MNVHIIPCHKDNYSYVLSQGNSCVIIDACEFAPLDAFLQKQKLQPVAILTTHHHWDHVGGNEQFVEKYKIDVYGAHGDAERIPALTHKISPQQTLQLLGQTLSTFLIPGHTSHHIAYHFKDSNLLFVGDTVFSCGCGRLFEGSYAEMFETLAHIKSLPPQTLIYGGHEYSAKNTDFALSVEPGNTALVLRKKQVHELLQQNQPTLPTSLEQELQINPFLRCFSPEIKKTLGGNSKTTDLETFTALRKKRDTY